MAGAGLSSLRRLEGKYNHALLDDFPTKEECRRLDQTAGRHLTLLAGSPFYTPQRETILELAHRLDYESRGDPPPLTRASRVHHNEQVLQVSGNLHELIDRSIAAGKEVSFVTLIGRGDDLGSYAARHFDPRRSGRKLHADIDRQIIGKGLRKDGWAILATDCEYQLVEDTFRFHWHGFACGGELDAIDGLRDIRKYRSPTEAPDGERDPVRFRAWLTREPLNNIGYLSRYPFKDAWRCRTVPSNQEGNRLRTWPDELPAPLAVIERQFYDRWSLQDISVVRGLRVIDGRFVETRHDFVGGWSS